MKHVAFAAFVLSFGLCMVYEVRTRIEIARIRAHTEAARQELQSLHAIDREVQAYQVKKDALQRRIDAITALRRNDLSDATIAALLTADQTHGVKAARVIDSRTLEVRTADGVKRVAVKR